MTMLVPKTKKELMSMIEAQVVREGPACDLNHIDVSAITDMSELFKNSPFNGDISRWNVANVTNMSEMFMHSDFNGDISKWNTSKVKTMNWMFSYSHFNGDISNWDVSKVQTMDFLFLACRFEGDISRWDVSRVHSMREMFYGGVFNGDISQWNVSNVQNMACMFSNCEFRGDISNWDTSNVLTMAEMFKESMFHGDLSRWDVSCVMDARGMFMERKSKTSDVIQGIPSWQLANDCRIDRMIEDANESLPEHIAQHRLFEYFRYDSKEIEAYFQAHPELPVGRSHIEWAVRYQCPLSTNHQNVMANIEQQCMLGESLGILPKAMIPLIWEQLQTTQDIYQVPESIFSHD